jgi:hypothetical protein
MNSDVDYRWVTVDDVALYCNDPSHVCTSTARCGSGTLYRCTSGYSWTTGVCQPPCTPESNAAFCQRLRVPCGIVTARDNCGAYRTVSCGACAVCGNGVCESGENGRSCGQDCCDFYTSCTQTQLNRGSRYCRSMNRGAYRWVTPSDVTRYCDDPSDICVTTAHCGGGTLYRCKTLPGGWATGSCP